MREIGCTAQVAGGVPAMCDGVTQGQDGMELSLLSRDLIAQCTAMSLSHQMFDGVLALGICDKIVPGLMMGGAEFWLSACALCTCRPHGVGFAQQREAAYSPALC